MTAKRSTSVPRTIGVAIAASNSRDHSPPTNHTPRPTKAQKNNIVNKKKTEPLPAMLAKKAYAEYRLLSTTSSTAAPSQTGPSLWSPEAEKLHNERLRYSRPTPELQAIFEVEHWFDFDLSCELLMLRFDEHDILVVDRKPRPDFKTDGTSASRDVDYMHIHARYTLVGGTLLASAMYPPAGKRNAGLAKVSIIRGASLEDVESAFTKKVAYRGAQIMHDIPYAKPRPQP